MVRFVSEGPEYEVTGQSARELYWISGRSTAGFVTQTEALNRVNALVFAIPSAWARFRERRSY